MPNGCPMPLAVHGGALRTPSKRSRRRRPRPRESVAEAREGMERVNDLLGEAQATRQRKARR